MKRTSLATAAKWLALNLLIGSCADVDGDDAADRDGIETSALASAVAEEPARFDVLFDETTTPEPRHCTGKPGRKRGRSNERVSTGFLTSRTFVYYAPQGLDPNEPAPMVIVPHGFTMSGDEMYR